MTKLLSELAKGNWSGATAYTIGDIVDNDGSGYICIANHTNQEPPNVTYWALLSNKGDTGVSDTPGDTGVQGDTGVTGSTGANSTVAGATGVTGATGSAGEKGDTGVQGATGAGTQGDTGVSNVAGATGVTGATGTTGATGIAGGEMSWQGGWITATGYLVDDAVENDGSAYICILNHTSGASTEPGVGGSWETNWSLMVEKGDTGVQGATGAGTQGNTGVTGATGTAGAVGATGVGNTGVTGATGAVGATGAKGDTGNAGNTGVTGATGVSDVAGDTGEQGDTGIEGTQYPWEGQWVTATAYVLNDCVHHNGSGYICILGHTSGSTTEPGVGGSWETNWDLLVERGLQGDTGADSTVPGATGVTGDTGNAGNTGVTGATGAGGGSAWGSITGTLSDQTDLQTALDAKANLAGGVVFNEAGADVDFRVEGDNDTHLIFADGGAGFVGINESTHDSWAKLIVNGGSAFKDDFRFQKGAGMQYIARYPTGTTGTDLMFQVRGDTFVMYGAGGIVVNEGGDPANDFRVEGDTDVNLLFTDASTDRIGISTDAPAGKLEIEGSADEIQLYIAGNATQTANIMEIRNSGNTLLTRFDPDGFLVNSATYTFSSGEKNMINLSPTAVPTSSANFYFYKGGTTLASGSAHSGTIGTMKFDITKAGSGTTSNVRFVDNTYFISGSGETTTLHMYKGSVIKNNTGKIGTAYGMELEIGNNNATNNIDNLYYLYLNTPTATGQITNEYGLYIENMNTGTTNSFAILTNAGNIVFNEGGADSDFRVEGDTDANLLFTDASTERVGIGEATPTGKIHVDQNSATGAIPVIHLEQADVSEEIVEITSTAGVGNAIELIGSKTLTTTEFIKVTINGNVRYIPAGTIA